MKISIWDVIAAIAFAGMILSWVFLSGVTNLVITCVAIVIIIVCGRQVNKEGFDD